MDLNWKLNKTEHIVQDEWIDFRKESFILPDGKEFSPFYNYSRRNFVVIIASVFLLSYLFKMTGVWLAFPVAEAITFIASLSFLVGIKRKNNL